MLIVDISGIYLLVLWGLKSYFPGGCTTPPPKKKKKIMTTSIRSEAQKLGMDGKNEQ